MTPRQQRILAHAGANGSTSTLRLRHPHRPVLFSARRLTLMTVLSLFGLLALTATPAFAARGRVFSTTFGKEGSGPGELKEPWGVAVNEATTGPTAGDVYVADFGNNRVQWFSFNAVSKSYEVAGQVTAADGSGAGTLTEGSSVIESFASSSGALVVGQSISGAGIPAETKITAVEAFGVVKISNPVEAGKGGSLVPLTAEQPLLEPREIAVDNSPGGPSSGDVYVTSGEFEHVVVDKFTPAGGFLGQISELPQVRGSGDLEAGSNVVASLVASSGIFLIGEAISGAGIPAGTTITETCEIDKCGNNETLELKLSNPVEAGATGAGVALTAKTGPFNSITGLAVDPSGALLLAEEHAHPFGGILSTIDRFDSASANKFKRTCGVNESLGFGLAVDSHDNLYVPWRPLGVAGVAELSSECSVLDETIGAKSPAAAAGITRSGVAVEAAAGNVYVDNVESIGQFAAADGSETARFGSGHLAVTACEEESRITCLGGLAVNGATAGPTAGDVYAVVGKGARVVVFAPEAPAAPKVESESVDKVTNDSATLQAEINPRSVTGEASTEYHFIYGPCPGAPATCAGSEYPSKTNVESLAPSFEVDSASADLEGLQPETTYHYRVLASNKDGSTEGTERTFTTHGTGAFQLADGRAWEMVSPAEKQGALIEPLGASGTSTAVGAATQAAAAGGAVVYAASEPTEPQPAGFAATAEVLSIRGAAGWSSHDISVSHGGPAGALTADELPFYSENLSVDVVQPTGSAFVPLAEDASEQTAYLRDGQTGALTPLVTGCPAAPASCPPAIQAHANVPVGTAFGNLGSGDTCPPSVANCGPQFIAATPDFKHIVLASNASLTGVATNPGASVRYGGGPLYLWSADAPASQQLQLVTLLPPNEAGEELPAQQPSIGYEGGAGWRSRGALSADGSHVFFSDGPTGHLYMRDTVARKTIQIDLPEPGCNTCGGGAEQAEFDFASSDGSRVFFMDTQKLTADGHEYAKPRGTSGKPTAGADLYVCEVHEDACTLRDLAPAGTVLGTMPGASRDGTWVYFVANGALASGAVNGNCPNYFQEAEPPPSNATCNLYVEHDEAGTWGPPRLVTILSAFDETDWTSRPSDLTTRVSADGNWLAFMSQRSLTGYDNRDAVSGKPDQEVYLYNAEHNQLTCASCNPSGARPHGGERSPLISNTNWRQGTWLSASIPGWVKTDEFGVTQRYLPRSLTNSGRLFFDSYDALVPKDANGTGDVYEFEPAGLPAGSQSCSAASGGGGVVYRPARSFEVEGLHGEEAAGCVGLISSGTSSEEAAFLDASETGGDVYFLSTAKLSSLDVEGGRTVYDAHECTAVAACIAPPPQPAPPCNTEASCKAAPAPQPSIFGPSGSATFSGPGNPAPPPPPKGKTAAQVRAEKLAKALKACHKDRNRKKRKACERAAHRAYGAATKTNRKAHR